jgi:hypothetical protein
MLKHTVSTGYTSAPTLSFPGAGAGTGASATATLDLARRHQSVECLQMLNA